jgi:hypothetical protein
MTLDNLKECLNQTKIDGLNIKIHLVSGNVQYTDVENGTHDYTIDFLCN